MLSPPPRGFGDLLGSSTAGMAGGEALAAAGSGCKFAIAAMPWWSAVWGGSPELPPRAPSAAMLASHTFLPATSDISLTLVFGLGSLGRENRICCFGGKKNHDLEKAHKQIRNEGSWTVSLRATTTGMGKEREFRERDGSHKRSRKYSRKLRERTPLQWKKRAVFPGMSLVRCLDSTMYICIFSSCNSSKFSTNYHRKVLGCKNCILLPRFERGRFYFTKFEVLSTGLFGTVLTFVEDGIT